MSIDQLVDIDPSRLVGPDHEVEWQVHTTVILGLAAHIAREGSHPHAARMLGSYMRHYADGHKPTEALIRADDEFTEALV